METDGNGDLIDLVCVVGGAAVGIVAVQLLLTNPLDSLVAVAFYGLCTLAAGLMMFGFGDFFGWFDTDEDSAWEMDDEPDEPDDDEEDEGHE